MSPPQQTIFWWDYNIPPKADGLYWCQNNERWRYGPEPVLKQQVLLADPDASCGFMLATTEMIGVTGYVGLRTFGEMLYWHEIDYVPPPDGAPDWLVRCHNAMKGGPDWVSDL